MTRRRWSDKDLINAAQQSRSYRQVIRRLGLVEAGGNYVQIKKYIVNLKIDISHFHHKSWNKGMRGIGKMKYSLNDILKKDNDYQSYKLKRRLFAANLKQQQCEECGWAVRALDGRLPLELDHINGDRRDNRLSNLRILCPNCHSLKPTHRGKMKGKYLARVVER